VFFRKSRQNVGRRVAPQPHTTAAVKILAGASGTCLAWFNQAEEKTRRAVLERRTPWRKDGVKGANVMARYGKKAAQKVKKAMRERKRGKLKSGRSGKRVTSRKQAIAIGLSEARRAGAKVPRKKSKKK
jgi:hypothetical protein